ncbi:MAG: thioredoxin domain-containing protein [Chitinophagaceae bacterium]
MKSVTFMILFVAFTLGMQAQKNTTLSPDEFEKSIIQPQVQLLDVRTSGEFKNRHIKNAMQADWNDADQFKDRIQYLDKSKPIMIYCASGGRSHAAAEWLRNNGYNSVQELKGGMTAWNTQDKPTEGLSSVKQMNKNEYNNLLNSHGTIMIEFGAPWCPPCKKMEPVLNQLEAELKTSFKLIKIDGGIHTDIMKQVGVDALPVFIIYKNGKETWRKKGIADIGELKTRLAS